MTVAELIKQHKIQRQAIGIVYFGEVYPCKPDIFEMTYDEVGE